MASTWIVYLFYWPQNNVQTILAKWKNTLHGTWYVQRRRRRRVNNGDLSSNQQPPPKRKRKIGREKKRGCFIQTKKLDQHITSWVLVSGKLFGHSYFPSNFSSTPFHSPGFTRKLLCSPISIFIDSPRFAQDRTLIVANCLPAFLCAFLPRLSRNELLLAEFRSTAAARTFCKQPRFTGLFINVAESLLRLAQRDSHVRNILAIYNVATGMDIVHHQPQQQYWAFGSSPKQTNKLVRRTAEQLKESYGMQ